VSASALVTVCAVFNLDINRDILGALEIGFSSVWNARNRNICSQRYLLAPSRKPQMY